MERPKGRASLPQIQSVTPLARSAVGLASAERPAIHGAPRSHWEALAAGPGPCASRQNPRSGRERGASGLRLLEPYCADPAA